MDKLESMGIFVRVVERGSFSAAADDFRLSGTMVGTHIRTLEQLLGARLLNRTTRRQSLTEVGQLYYERCKQILGDVTDAESCAAELHAVPRGRLKVSTPVSFGVHALAPACGDYLARNPQVAIDLAVSDKLTDIVGGGFDVAIRIGDIPDSTMIARPLSPYRSILCAAHSYLDERGIPMVPSELSRHTCLGFAHPVAGHNWRLEGPEGPIDVPVTVTMSANNGEALRMAALSGLGIIMQPEILLKDDIQAGRLFPLLCAFSPKPKPMHVLTFRHQRTTPKVRSFVDFILERFS